MAVLTGGVALKKRLSGMANQLTSVPSVSVGFLSGATYPDGTSVPLVAAVNEFGAPSRGQPPRPFFRNMVAAKKAEWGPTLGKQMVATNYVAEDALDRMGQGIKGQLQQSIRDLTDPPLKAQTIQRKGFDKPLIDTGHMLNSVDYRIDSV